MVVGCRDILLGSGGLGGGGCPSRGGWVRMGCRGGWVVGCCGGGGGGGLV